jgi:hypothetical protein
MKTTVMAGLANKASSASAILKKDPQGPAPPCFKKWLGFGDEPDKNPLPSAIDTRRNRCEIEKIEDIPNEYSIHPVSKHDGINETYIKPETADGIVNSLVKQQFDAKQEALTNVLNQQMNLDFNGLLHDQIEVQLVAAEVVAVVVPAIAAFPIQVDDLIEQGV